MFSVYLLFFQHSFQTAFNLLLIYKKDIRNILLLKIELQQPYEKDFKLYYMFQQVPSTRSPACLGISSWPTVILPTKYSSLTVNNLNTYTFV
jgi:hypothetical protein